MSGSSVGKLLTNATLPTSLSGAKISKDEIVKAWNEANKPEGGDPAGKPIQIAEAQLFQDLIGKPMTAAAKKFLQTEILAKIPNLIQGGGPSTGPNTPMSPTGAAKPVFINAEGWAVSQNNLAGIPATNQAEEGIYRLALQISNAGQTGKRLDALDKLRSRRAASSSTTR